MYGQTALHYTAISGDTNVVFLLLQHGADLTQKDNFGKTCLDYFRKSGAGADACKMLSDAAARTINGAAPKNADLLNR